MGAAINWIPGSRNIFFPKYFSSVTPIFKEVYGVGSKYERKPDDASEKTILNYNGPFTQTKFYWGKS